MKKAPRGQIVRVCDSLERRRSGPPFKMLQARVDHFFHTVQLGAPKIPHVVEAAVDRVKLGVDPGKFGVNAIATSRVIRTALKKMGRPIAR